MFLTSYLLITQDRKNKPYQKYLYYSGTRTYVNKQQHLELNLNNAADKCNACTGQCTVPYMVPVLWYVVNLLY